MLRSVVNKAAGGGGNSGTHFAYDSNAHAATAMVDMRNPGEDRMAGLSAGVTQAS
jgi:hypothetical protein